MALSKQQIELEVTEKGLKLVSAADYKNLESTIIVECDKGHVFTTTLSDVRKGKICSQCSRQGVNLKEGVPTKTGYRIIALDQASNLIGVSIWDNGKLVYARRVQLTGEVEQRYEQLFTFLTKEVIPQWRPDELVFEDIQYQNNAITHKILGGVLGICKLAATLYKIPHEVVLNKVWQSDFNIKGVSRTEQKNNTIATVEELFNVVTNDDIADSILLGYYIVRKRTDKWTKRLF